MDDKDIVQKLGSLAQLDIDAVHVYKEAIEKVEDPKVRETLVRYCEDHERHIAEFSAKISRLGETPPDFSSDFKGFFVDGFISLRSITGIEDVLNALHSNEKLTNKNYSEACNWNLPTNIQTIVDLAYEDEKHHLEYIEMELKKRE